MGGKDNKSGGFGGEAWGTLEYCPRAAEATVEYFTVLVVILSLCQIQLGLIGGARKSKKEGATERDG